MKKIQEEMRPVMIRSIIADRGLEFNNKFFKEHFKGVNIFYKDPELFNSALAIVDRYCRTIRELIQRYFTAYGTTKWHTRLQDFTDNINNSINSTIKNTPNDVWYGREINEQDLTDDTIKLNVGDLVRIKNNPETFKRKHTNNYSETVYTVEKLDGLGYRLLNKRRKYFISELKLVNGFETPELSEPVEPRRTIEYIPNRQAHFRQLELNTRAAARERLMEVRMKRLGRNLN